jgi:glycosyltransferase involved in cell wall biosynthesis
VPKVSVVTGYYNRSASLRLTIDSILSQTYTDFELIVFDDCSTDDTKDVLEALKLEYRDPRLMIRLHETNKGFTVGMIEAIASSTGEYICVQGSGDYAYPDRLAMQVEVLEENESVGVVGCFYENFIETLGVARLRDKVSDDITYEGLLEENVFSHGEVMFRRSCYDAVGGYRREFVNCQDYDLWLRLIKICNFKTVKQLLYRRYVRYDGVSYNPASFLKQVRYGFLCKDVSIKNDIEAGVLLSKISAENLNSLVLIEEPRVQKLIVKAIIRSAIFDGKEEAIVLAREGISSGFLSMIMISFVHIYCYPLFKPFRLLMAPILGIKS